MINDLVKIMSDLSNVLSSDTFTGQSLRCYPEAFYK